VTAHGIAGMAAGLCRKTGMPLVLYSTCWYSHNGY